MQGDPEKVPWSLLHDTYYRKLDVYEMLWKEMDLECYVIKGAPFGGPIAMVRDERKVWSHGYGDDEGATPKMRIFTSAGKLISEFTWTHKGLVAFGWSDREELVCVLRDGTGHIYTIHGERTSVFNLGPECMDQGVAECHMWGDGLVVRTQLNSHLYGINSLYAPTPFKLAKPNLDNRPPMSMAVIPPWATESGKPEVLLATASGSIILVDHETAQDQQLEMGPFVSMVVSPSASCVACFSDEGTLYVMSTNLKDTLSKFSTNSRVPPRDLAWCGEESVLLYWNKILLMVNPAHGDFVKYSYDGPLVLVTEADGVRVVTSKKCEILQPVPDAIDEIFGEDKDTPGALLLAASTAFENKCVKADENMRAIKEAGDEELEAAIDQCLEAAAHEFNYSQQRILLKAASFGKLFCDEYKADHFVDVCRILRVLNAVRHYEVQHLLRDYSFTL